MRSEARGGFVVNLEQVDDDRQMQNGGEDEYED